MTSPGGVRPAGLRPRMLLIAGMLLAGAAVASVLLGPANIPPSGVFRELADRLPGLSVESGLTEAEAAIIWELRVPRIVLGGLVGAMLAIAGGAYQGVFRNPLADPYLLGVAAGAGVGATLAIAYAGALPTSTIPPAAFVGSVVAVAATYALGRSSGGRHTGATLILAGVAVAAFFTAVQTYLQQQRADTIRQVFSWILGRLSTVGWSDVRLLLPYVVLASVGLLLLRRHLDVLAVGEEEAATLGLDAGRARLLVVAAATLGTAAAVAVSGLIGFVGIIVPHAVRLLASSSYRVILPVSLLAGGAFLILADLLARSVTSGGELPIGVVTAFVGAPFFGLVLLNNSRRTA